MWKSLLVNVTREVISGAVFAVPLVENRFPVISAHDLLEALAYFMELRMKCRVFNTEFPHYDRASFFTV